MNKILIISSLIVILLGGYLPIYAMESVKEQSNFIKEYLDKGSLPELPWEIGNHIAQYVMENNPLVPWLVQQMPMPHKTLEGHGNAVYSGAFDRKGTKIVTASYDSTAKIWDVWTGQLIHTLQGHRDAVSSAVFDRKGTKIVTASYDNTAKIWDTSVHFIMYSGGKNISALVV